MSYTSHRSGSLASRSLSMRSSQGQAGTTTGTTTTTNRGPARGAGGTGLSRPQSTFSGRATTSGGRPGTMNGSGIRPRSAASVGTSGFAGENIICAVTESRGVSATVGICFVNLSTGDCVLSEICDSQTFVRTVNKLAVFDPREIVLPSTAFVPRKSKLCHVIEENVPGAKISQAPRKYFSEQLGSEYIEMFAFLEDAEALKVAVSAKFYALSAAGALLKHIEVTHNISFAMNSLRIKYQGCEASMLIDSNTVRSLELIQNLQNPKSVNSLFGLLNNTLTPMGARFLRSNILQPLTDVSILNIRLDAVEELIGHEEMFYAVRNALKPFQDVDRLLTALITIPTKPSLKLSEQAVNNVITLKQALTCIPAVHESLTSARSGLLCNVRNLCNAERMIRVRELIDAVINEDVTGAKSPLDLRNQRCYAVKSGVNGLLDVARQTYKEATEDIFTLAQEYTTNYNLPFDLKFEISRGFYLRLPVVELEDRVLDPIFINVIERKRILEFTTLELIKRNAKIGDSLTEVLLMSDKTVQDLIEDVRKEVSVLYKIAEGVALLDMVASFAHLCTIQDYVRPEFTTAIAIKDGRHPLREKIQNGKFVPNDVYADGQSRFQLITGCNMSGKSTYLRMVSLMAVMAQIGSFVPASYASFPITHHLFARVSMDEGVEASASTFASEMRETAFILRNVGNASLVVIDELGRGTSVRDGLAIALAVCEALIEKEATVLFATHFRELPAILAERPGVVALHMHVENTTPDTVTMSYKIRDGTVSSTPYGITLAKTLCLPPSILSQAIEIANQLSERISVQKQKSHAQVRARRTKTLLLLKETLMQARESRLEEGQLRGLLARLQGEFVGRMMEGDEEGEEGGMEVDGE